jgi:hypothetical protein
LAEALTLRSWLNATLVAGTAALLGLLIAVQPELAIGLTALVIATALAFFAPVTHLTLLLALTVIVPYSVQNHYSPGSTGDSPGLLPSDILLLTGLVRVAFVLPHLRLERRRLVVVGLILLSLLLTVIAAVRGVQAGFSLSDVGAEFRALGGGVAAALIAIAVMADPGGLRRMTRALVLLGLALGLWGLAQWVFQINFGGDFGVRGGVSLTSNGRGQVQGGLFAFPVAVIVASAALASGQLRRGVQRGSVIVVLALNAVSLLLTFERTFWVVTAVGVLLVALRAGRPRRARALMWIAVVSSAGLLTLSAVAPGTLKTAEQRLFSIGAYQVDNSVRYRVVESGLVLDKVRAKPLMGWGLADTIYWGQPWTQTPPSTQSYSHVGYLWLFWREGLLGGGVLLLLLVLSALWPGRAAGGGVIAGVRVGCQASIVALLIADLLFPAFHGPEGTFVLGFLVAYCAIPVVRPRPRPAFGPPPTARLGSRRPALGRSTAA